MTPLENARRALHDHFNNWGLSAHCQTPTDDELDTVTHVIQGALQDSDLKKFFRLDKKTDNAATISFDAVHYKKSLLPKITRLAADCFTQNELMIIALANDERHPRFDEAMKFIEGSKFKERAITMMYFLNIVIPWGIGLRINFDYGLDENSRVAAHRNSKTYTDPYQTMLLTLLFHLRS